MFQYREVRARVPVKNHQSAVTSNKPIRDDEDLNQLCLNIRVQISMT